MLTIIESAKLAANKGEVKRAGVIATFARASAWWASLPIMNISGSAYAYSREGTLPGVSFRGINQAYPESTGIINPFAETLKIAGGDLDVDKALVRMHGLQIRTQHEAMKIKALAAEMTRALIKGDTETSPTEFDGLQKRVTGAQIVSNSASSGGAGLSLAKLDEAIDAVPGAQAIWLTRALARKFSKAARTSSVAGNLQMTTDAFGRRIMTYNDLPLVVPYPENDGVEPIAFDEAYTGGGTANGTSLYVVRFGEDGLKGIQNGEAEVDDLGQLQSEPKYRTRFEWLVGLVIEHGKAVARLRDIADADITA